MIRNIVLTFFMVILFCACDSVMPGGVWDKFESDLRLKKQSDQGPWGGTRAYYWKNKTAGHFNKKRVIDFASANGWNLIDSTKNISSEMSNTSNNGESTTFSIQIGPFEPSSESNFLEESFPRWIKKSVSLFRFKTGWLVYYPGTDNCTEVNGFIVISDDEREMAVYHIWGE